MRNFTVAMLLMLFSVISINAQNIVKGIVSDGDTEKPLQNVIVSVKNTSVNQKTGIDGVEIYEPSMPLQDQHAVDFIIETLRNEPSGTITLCPIGPLTNIATAFERAPDIVERVQESVLMGGAYFEVGNLALPRASRAVTTITKTDRTRYSRDRKAMAPS